MDSIVVQLLFLFVVFVVTAVVMWCITSNYNLKTANRRMQANQEKYQRLLRQFTDKLARVDDVYESLGNLTSYIYEETNAESVGIYILDTSVGVEANQVKGESCIGPFPVFGNTPYMDVNEDGAVIEHHRKAHFRTEIIHSGEGFLGEVIHSLRPRCLDVRGNRLSEYSLPKQISTLMAMPLTFEGRFIGLLVAVNRRRSFRPFEQSDLDNFVNLSVQIAFASNLIIIYEERQKQDRIMQELTSYANLQKLLLPEIPRGVKDYRFASYQTPAMEVSGDFYDFGMLDDHRILIIIADATGKNLPACLITSMCRSFVRCLKDHFTDVSSFLLDLNRLIYSNSDESQFITLNALVLDTESNQCVFGCAGHTPLLVRSSDGTVQTMKPNGAALGMWNNDADTEFETVSFEFLPGMKLCLYTDGINETVNEKGELFGDQRLKDMFAASSDSPSKIVTRIVAAVKDFSGGLPQSDDQTMMVISRRKDGKIL